MRRLLGLTTALVAATGLCGAAMAQTAPASPIQGQLIAPPGAYVGPNNNNSAVGTAVRGPAANPTPGTMVIHLGGRVMFQWFQSWNSLNTPGNERTSNQMQTWLRLYPGMDAMAANGLRYGGQMEIRTNNSTLSARTATGVNTNPGSGASGQNNTQSLYLRRAFVYMGTNELGIIRFGQSDGLIGLFDGGKATFQSFSGNGALNGSDLQSAIGGNSSPPFVFLAGAGNEYTPNKVVYLSPNFSGFDFGVGYSPAAASGSGFCGATVSGACSNVITSSNPLDGERYKDLVNAGLRYSGPIGPVNLLAYGIYNYAGHVNNSLSAAASRAAVGAPATSTWNGGYDNLSFGQAGVAVTYAGFTVGGAYIGGAVNGQLGARPSGGSTMNSYLVGAQYSTGPLTIGVAYEQIENQGAVALTGLSQRKEYALDIGGTYNLAPGLQLWADYIYQNRKQSGFNFQTGTVGTANNSVQGQGFVLGTTVTW
ncbi:MAG: porin [Acetobacteraceae bacterium]